MAKPNTSKTARPSAPPSPGDVPSPAHQNAPGPARTARGRKGKPSVWKRWGKQLERFQTLMGKIGTAAAASLGSDSADVRRARADLIPLAAPAAGFAKQVAALIVLDAEGIPAPKYAPAPKFAVGQAVRIAKAALPKYLKSGFFTPAELAELQVSKVSSNGKAFLCASKAGAVQVGSFRHLENRGD